MNQARKIFFQGRFYQLLVFQSQLDTCSLPCFDHPQNLDEAENLNFWLPKTWDWNRGERRVLLPRQFPLKKIPSERDFCGFDWQPLEAACTDFASGASRPSPIHTSSKPPIQSCKVHFGAHLNLNKSFYWAELDMRYLRAQTPLAPVQYSSNARAQHSKITFLYAI